MSKKLLISPLLVLGIISLVSNPVTQSFASTSNNLTITGNGDTALMELKATKENGKSNKVSDFRLDADNVLFIEQDSKVTVQDNADFTRALVTNASDNEKRIGINSNGIIDFAGYTQGVYTLDVVVDDSRAYEAIIVIGEQDEQVINKEITRVNNKQIVNIEIWIEVDCGTGYHLDEYGFCIPDEPISICYFDPMDPVCDPIDGKCPDGYGFNDDDRCIPHGDCPDGYVRADDDETGTCYEPDDLVECDDGSIRLPGDTCPRLYDVDECEPGFNLIVGICQPYGVCTADSVYNPETGKCDPIVFEGEPLTPTPEPTPIPTPTTPTPTPPIDPNLLARSQPQCEFGIDPETGLCNKEDTFSEPLLPTPEPLPPTPEPTTTPEEEFSIEEEPEEEVEEEPEEEPEEDPEDEPEGNGESTEDSTSE